MKRHLGIILLLIVGSIVLFINVGSYGVVESSDARYAEIAREMYVSGEYLHPDLLDIHHYHKPPLTYQITALGYKLFGINAFGARFFLQIAVLLQVLLVYALGLALFDKRRIALWAAMIYFSFPLVLASSRNLTTDAFLTTFVLGAILSWVRYRRSARVRYLYGFTLALALGFLTKGPVVFIVPVIFVLAYNATERPKKRLGRHHIGAWLLFVVLASSWFVYICVQNQAFIDYFLVRHTVERFSKNVFNRTEPFWYFLALAPLLGMPWLLILPYLLRYNRSAFRARSVSWALLLGVSIPLFFFSISSSKRILYILPFFGLLAILIAMLLEQIPPERARRVQGLVLGYVTVVLSAFMATLVVDMGFIFPWQVPGLAFLSIPIFIGLFTRSGLSYQSRSVFGVLLVSLIMLGNSGLIMSSNQLQVNSAKPVTDFILAKGLSGRQIIVYNTRKPSIAFGLNKSIISLYDGDGSLNRETQFEEDEKWKDYLIDVTADMGKNKLRKILQEPSVLLIHRFSLSQGMEWLPRYYGNKEIMGRWSIYY